MELDNASRQGVNTPVQRDYRLKGRLRTAAIRAFRIEPRAKLALMAADPRLQRTLTLEEGLDGRDPGAVLDARMKQGALVDADRKSFGPAGIGMPDSRPRGKIGSLHGLRDAVALRQFATQPQQHQALFGGLDTFGHGLTVKGPGQSNNAFEDGQVIGVFQNIAYKAGIDFKVMRWQLLQFEEREMAGAKVLERGGDAHL